MVWGTTFARGLPGGGATCPDRKNPERDALGSSCGPTLTGKCVGIFSPLQMSYIISEINHKLSCRCKGNPGFRKEQLTPFSGRIRRKEIRGRWLLSPWSPHGFQEGLDQTWVEKRLSVTAPITSWAAGTGA